MNRKFNVVKFGATRKGKSVSAVMDMLTCPNDAYVVFDPHKESLAALALVHLDGNVLFEKLSDVSHSLGFEFLTPSDARDPLQRAMENQRKTEAFVEILLRTRGSDGMAGTPLMAEWVSAALSLYLNQRTPKPLHWLPNVFQPETPEFAAFVRDCTVPEIRHKFRQLEGMNPRSLRAEVGSASRFIGGVFRSPSFVLRSRGGFNLGKFLQGGGKLLLERGDLGDDTMRTIMGAISLLVIDHAKRRLNPFPTIHMLYDEATNARIVGDAERRGIAETSKNGLHFEFYVQNDDFPGGSAAFLQNCLRHEVFGCPHYDLARKLAVDILAGFPASEQSRTQRLEALTNDIMNLEPGWRWVRDPKGSRKEYVPMLEHPWPDWPGLREQKLQEKLAWIYNRPEYQTRDLPEFGARSEEGSDHSSTDTAPQRNRSETDSSPAERLRRGGRRRAEP